MPKRSKRGGKRRLKAGSSRSSTGYNSAPDFTITGPGSMRSGTRIQNSINGFPDRYRTKLVYSERIVFAITGGFTTTYRFSGNGLFDPNVTGTGSQPINFDTLSIVYLRYRCYGSACRVQIGTGTFIDLALFPANATVTVTQEEASAQQYAKSAYWCLPLGSGATPNISSSIGSQKLLGRNVAGSDAAQALVTAQPAEQWYWTIVGSASDRSTAINATLAVTITYDVEFFDREAQGLSLAQKKMTLTEVQAQNRAVVEKGAKVLPDLKDAKSEQKGSLSWGDSDMDEPGDYEEFLRWKKAFSTAAPKSVARVAVPLQHPP